MDYFMNDKIPATADALLEALKLSTTILNEIELDQVPLSSIALKTARLARLLNEFDYQQIMQYEVAGFPSSPDGLSPENWRLCVLCGRDFQQKDGKTQQTKTYAYTESIAQLDAEIAAARQGIDAAADRDISISSANPSQYVHPPQPNKFERDMLQLKISQNTKRLSERRSFIYRYVLQKHYELKFSGIAGDVFSRIRQNTDNIIGKLVPQALQKFSAIYDNLQSENPENWANAVHGCRRALESLADALFPPQDNDRIKEIAGQMKSIKLGPGNYKNRLLCYVEDNSASKRFEEIVGSTFEYLADRLDSVIQASQKGTHDAVNRDEADRYVVYTYMIVSDILSLYREKAQQ
jgi:hypothetical protein